MFFICRSEGRSEVKEGKKEKIEDGEEGVKRGVRWKRERMVVVREGQKEEGREVKRQGKKEKEKRQT